MRIIAWCWICSAFTHAEGLISDRYFRLSSDFRHNALSPMSVYHALTKQLIISCSMTFTLKDSYYNFDFKISLPMLGVIFSIRLI